MSRAKRGTKVVAPAAPSSRACSRRYPHPFLRLILRPLQPPRAAISPRPAPLARPIRRAAKTPCLCQLLSPHTFPVPSFRWAPVSAVSTFTAPAAASAPLGVYRRKHSRSQGWPPHCGRLIRVECTSFGQRTPITTTAPAAQCGRTSDSPGPASSALSSHQALSVPSLNYILFTNTRPDFRWSLNKG